MSDDSKFGEFVDGIFCAVPDYLEQRCGIHPLVYIVALSLGLTASVAGTIHFIACGNKKPSADQKRWL